MTLNTTLFAYAIILTIMLKTMLMLEINKTHLSEAGDDWTETMSFLYLKTVSDYVNKDNSCKSNDLYKTRHNITEFVNFRTSLAFLYNVLFLN